MARDSLPKSKVETLDRALSGLFRTLQSRPVPDSLRSIVEQLHDQPAVQPRKSA